MSNDHDDDYMSDKYLQSDVRVSLVQDRVKKRLLHINTKKIENQKIQKELNQEKKGYINTTELNRSLQKPIETDNKGCQLLMKMGFKPGDSLGKGVLRGNSFKALTEPITINIKNDRGGFGRETALKEFKERQQLQKEKQKLDSNTKFDEFRKRFIQKTDEDFNQRALKSCQEICENLDFNAKIESPEKLWYWPERKIEDNDNDCEEQNEETPISDVDEFSTLEKLEMLTNYLRTSYNFCYWCGVNYKDSKDLTENCPGLSRNDH